MKSRMMVRGQRWRYWAHRLGILPSPSCTLMYVRFGSRKKSEAYYFRVYERTGYIPLDVAAMIKGLEGRDG